MKVLENTKQVEWADIIERNKVGLTRVLCILDEGTPAGKAVTAILKIFENHKRHDTIILADDQLLVKLVKLQFDSQLRNSKRFKVGNVIEDVKIVKMNINTDAVSFAHVFQPDILVINQNSLKYFYAFTSVETVVIKNIK